MERDELIAAPAAAQMAFRFTSGVVRAMLPLNHAGVYALLQKGQPVYIGRSDRCLRRRLSTHGYLGVASHVVWEVAASACRAFHLECFWFHHYQYRLLNVLHPARPAGTTLVCPFCSPAEARALARALASTSHNQI